MALRIKDVLVLCLYARFLVLYLLPSLPRIRWKTLRAATACLAEHSPRCSSEDGLVLGGSVHGADIRSPVGRPCPWRPGLRCRRSFPGGSLGRSRSWLVSLSPPYRINEIYWTYTASPNMNTSMYGSIITFSRRSSRCFPSINTVTLRAFSYISNWHCLFPCG